MSRNKKIKNSVSPLDTLAARQFSSAPEVSEGRDAWGMTPFSQFLIRAAIRAWEEQNYRK